MLVFGVGHGPVSAEQAEFCVSVGEGDSSKEATSGGVTVPVVCMVAPSFANDDDLSTYGCWVSWAGFGNGGLEY